MEKHRHWLPALALGAVSLILLSFIVPEPPTQWTLSYIGILGFMSIFSTAMCWWLWIYILDRVPAWEASLSILGTPVVAILLIGGGLALLPLLGWAASRRNPQPALAAKIAEKTA